MKHKILLLITSLLITNSALALSEIEGSNHKGPVKAWCELIHYVTLDWEARYKNGNLMKVVPYLTATRRVDGIVKTYFETGELLEKLKFNEGRLVEISVYEKNGDKSLYYKVPGKEEYTFECPNYGPNLHLTCHPDGVEPGFIRFNKDGSSSGIDRYFGYVFRARIYYKNGNLMKTVPYSGGVVHGTVETYYETGELFEKWKFDYGKSVAMIVYKKDGTEAVKVGLIEEIEELKPVEVVDEAHTDKFTLSPDINFKF